jgi:mannose-6-phosphate isomerase-like protein (cupin superfamily)
MKTAQITRHRKKFDVVATTRRAQFAVMTLKTGEASDEEISNEHPHSEQWLLVISGNGTATIIPIGGRRRTIKLKTGTLVAIEKGERHQIRNAGRKPLRTINFYSPPGYTLNGDVKNSAKN